MSVQYEWDIETVDDYLDILDHDFADKLFDLNPGDLGPFHRLVLVRNEGTDSEGLQDREWAYVKDEQLPDQFTGGSDVPKRFLRELRNWISSYEELRDRD